MREWVNLMLPAKMGLLIVQFGNSSGSICSQNSFCLKKTGHVFGFEIFSVLNFLLKIKYVNHRKVHNYCSCIKHSGILRILSTRQFFMFKSELCKNSFNPMSCY